MSARRRQQDQEPRRKKGKAKAVPTYDNYEDALAGGIEAEEQGERWGRYEKAQRFYETSVQLYERAATYSRTYDALYNCARVLYTLGTSHHLPPLSLKTLHQSVTLFAQSTSLTPDALLKVDSEYNRAQALLDLAEMAEDLAAENDVRILGWRLEAVEVLKETARQQKAFLDAQSAEDAGVPGQMEEGESAEENQEMDTADGSSSGGSVYEQFTPTPSSLLDTLLLLLDSYLTLWNTRHPTSMPSVEEKLVIQELVEEARHAATSADRLIELELGDINLLLTVDSITWDTDHDSQRSIDALSALLPRMQTLLNPTPGASKIPKEVHVELLTTLSSIHSRIAFRHSVASSPPLSQWSHLSLATSPLTTALTLPISVVSTPLSKASIYLALSALSVRRAKIAASAEKSGSLAVLKANAEVYAGKGLEDLSWKMFISSADGGGLRQAAVLVPERGGWAKEYLGYSTVMTLARALWRQSLTQDAQLSNEARGKLENLVRAIESFNRSAGGGRKIDEEALKKFLEDLTDDEGALEEEEKTFWQDFVTAINR